MLRSIPLLLSALLLTTSLAACGGDSDKKADADMLDVGDADMGSAVCGQTVCDAGQRCCDYACVDDAADAAHCGACGNACADGQTCMGGLCTCGTEVCSPDTDCCLESLTCLNLRADPDNCGACGNSCDAGEVCLAGQCACQTADGSYESCTADETCCVGAGCRDLEFDPQSCGACGLECGPGELCAQGVCDCGGTSGNQGPACGAQEACCGAPASCRPLDDPECSCGTSLCGSGQSCCDVDAVDTCVSTWREPQFCGGCGTSCAPAQSCLGGTCLCQGGVADCNMDNADGCEARLDRSGLHCGACNNACAAGEVCDGQGQCALHCQLGLTDCDGQCVDLNWDRAHCGTCNNACPAGQVANGAGQCDLTCLAGLTDCNGECVQLFSNRSHCGTCGAVCAPGEVCDGAGRCALTCVPGLSDCAGNCIDLYSDRAHCGACGNSCPSGEVCNNGQCETSCQTGATECDGACVDVRSNRFHCGTCGIACGSGERCVDGSCTVDCGSDPNVVSCGGQCVDLRSSRQHCGDCDTACTGAERCESGTCVGNCLAGFEPCGAACVDTTSSAAHCGVCGNVCGMTETCVDGVCCDAASGCPAPFAIDVSTHFSCAIDADGAASCWGSNQYGQLGTGVAGQTDTSWPVPVASLDGVMLSATDIATGADHVCAVVDDQTTSRVYCWGRNHLGQLGVGDVLDRNQPAEVLFDWTTNPAASVVAGDTHSCALLASGDVFCWGDNGNGQLGEGIASGLRTTPVAVVNLPAGQVVQVEAVDQTTCVIAVDGQNSAYCWGGNHVGCTGCTTDRLAPNLAQPVQPLVDPLSITTGGTDAGFCGVNVAGNPMCWHSFSLPQALGVTPSNFASLHPRTLSANLFCGISVNGQSMCWGYNELSNNVFGGQLGHSCTQQFGDCTDYVSMPMAVVDENGLPVDATAMAVSDEHACVIRSSGSVACWGNNRSGQLGVGDFVPNAPSPITSLTNTLEVVSNVEASCAVTATDGVWCWGLFDNNRFGGGVVPQQLPNSQGAVHVAVSETGACYIDGSGAVWCVGGGTRGALGDGCTGAFCPATATPTAVLGIDGVAASATAIAGGNNHFCAIIDTGALRCWGDNPDGQIGTTTPGGYAATPVDVPGLTNVVEVALGFAHSCALTQAGILSCWGRNDEGQLGIGMLSVGTSTPTVVAGLFMPQTIAANHLGTMAVLADGSVWAWGDNTNLQHGPLTAQGAFEPIPRQVTGLPSGTSVIDLDLGQAFACFVLDTNTVWCVGANADNTSRQPFNALGLPGATQTDQPTQLPAFDGTVVIDQVDVGEYHTCARSAGGQVWCWGDNTNGQLGVGAYVPWAATVRLP